MAAMWMPARCWLTILTVEPMPARSPRRKTLPATASSNPPAAAKAAGRAPRLRPLLESWGGATIAYRRRLVDAPSYTLNHEEVDKAMQEAVRFAEGLSPIEVVLDDVPRRNSLIFSVNVWQPTGAHPTTLQQVMARQKDIQFASRGKSHVARQAQIHRLRHVVRELARRLPNAHCASVAGAGHMLPLTHADDLAQLTTAHLAAS